jgi:mannosyl-oligosaccharide alpha-1,2-mannosidase
VRDGSLIVSQVLEWTKLSDLTKDSKYAEMAQKAEHTLLLPQPLSAEIFPGLVGPEIDIHNGWIQPSTASWGGGSDSFYEYLLKVYLYDRNTFGEYKARWVSAADSTIEHLASSPEGHPDITFLGQYDGVANVFVPQSGQLECFAGGNFLLGGITLKESKYMDFGLVGMSLLALDYLLKVLRN